MGLLKFIQDGELQIFTSNELKQQLTNWSKIDLQVSVEKLINANFLSRIQRALYCLPTFRDEYIIGQYLMPDGAVAYWSALHRMA